MKILVRQTLTLMCLIFAAVTTSKFIFALLNPNLRTLLLTDNNVVGLLWGLRLDASATAALGFLVTLVYFAELPWSRRFFFTRATLLASLFWVIGSTAVDAIYT